MKYKQEASKPLGSS